MTCSLPYVNDDKIFSLVKKNTPLAMKKLMDDPVSHPASHHAGGDFLKLHSHLDVSLNKSPLRRRNEPDEGGFILRITPKGGVFLTLTESNHDLTERSVF